MKKDGNSGKQERLAQALRANLRRRKSRGDGGDPNEVPESAASVKDSAFRD